MANIDTRTIELEPTKLKNHFDGNPFNAFIGLENNINNSYFECRTSYPPLVNVGDILSIDFECNAFEGDGLYIVTFDDNYVAVRLFDQIQQNIRVYEGLCDEVRVLTSDQLINISFIAKINKVFKSN